MGQGVRLGMGPGLLRRDILKLRLVLLLFVSRINSAGPCSATHFWKFFSILCHWGYPADSGCILGGGWVLTTVYTFSGRLLIPRSKLSSRASWSSSKLRIARMGLTHVMNSLVAVRSFTNFAMTLKEYVLALRVMFSRGSFSHPNLSWLLYILFVFALLTRVL